MDKSRFIIFFLALLLFSSCSMENDCPVEKSNEQNIGGRMSTNIAVTRGSVFKYTGVTQENIGEIGSLIDGNENTAFGYGRVSPRDPSVYGFSGYQVDLGSEYYVDNIQISSAHAGALSKYVGIVYILLQNGSAYTVVEIGRFGLNYPDLVDINVQAEVVGVRVSIDVEGYAGLEDTYAMVKEIYINGVDRSASSVKYFTISGATTLAKNNELHGQLHYKTSAGIESLALININSPKATNIRIMTPQGIKAFAKL